MKPTIGLFLFLFLTSCGSSKKIVEAHPLSNQYKYYFMQRCLWEGYNKDQRLAEITMDDSSVHNDFPLGVEGYKAANELAIEVVRVAIERNQKFKSELCNPCSEEEIKLMKEEGIYAGPAIMKACLDCLESEEFKNMVQSTATNWR